MNVDYTKTFKLMPRKIKTQVQSHVAREQVDQDLNLGNLTPDKIINSLYLR